VKVARANVMAIRVAGVKEGEGGKAIAMVQGWWASRWQRQ
jgi:hypothetical protein